MTNLLTLGVLGTSGGCGNMEHRGNARRARTNTRAEHTRASPVRTRRAKATTEASLPTAPSPILDSLGEDVLQREGLARQCQLHLPSRLGVLRSFPACSIICGHSACPHPSASLEPCKLKHLTDAWAPAAQQSRPVPEASKATYPPKQNPASPTRFAPRAFRYGRTFLVRSARRAAGSETRLMKGALASGSAAVRASVHASPRKKSGRITCHVRVEGPVSVVRAAVRAW